jgi:hypothetical protein
MRGSSLGFLAITAHLHKKIKGAFAPFYVQHNKLVFVCEYQAAFLPTGEGFALLDSYIV